MTRKLLVRTNEYHDSMMLMQINYKVAALAGVSKAAILMATAPNRRILEKFGFADQEMANASPSDMVIGLEANDEHKIAEALDLIDRLLREKVLTRRHGKRLSTQEAAIKAAPGTNLVLISIPGQFASREARSALSKGRHVFLFSDNVPVEEEIELKRMAHQEKLLVMGPDCGTAIIDGVGIGFANKVALGPVGIIGAAGTGIQELCVLLHRAGVGISQAIGLGGRDLSEAVGGLSCFSALDLLDKDSATECLVVVSKPPSLRVARKLIDRAGQMNKPTILCFLGQDPSGEDSAPLPPNVCVVPCLEHAATMAASEMEAQVPWRQGEILAQIEEISKTQREKLRHDQHYLRGIFSGGSLCYEAMALLRNHLSPLHSNIPIDGVVPLCAGLRSTQHTLLDLGDDYFTQGRVHPMIDPSPVAERILAEAADPEVAVVLFDLVLGFGAHPDPASVIAPAVEQATQRAERQERHLAFISHVCGTDEDLQDARKQEKLLRQVGVSVLPSNLQAAELARTILGGRP
jgi:FdrA protein